MYQGEKLEKHNFEPAVQLTFIHSFIYLGHLFIYSFHNVFNTSNLSLDF